MEKLLGKKWIIIAVAAFLAVSLAMVGYFLYMYNMAKSIEILGERYKRDIEYLDLTDKSISPEEYDEIQDKLPDCEIIWMVPMGKNHVRSDATEISANDISVDALPLLVYLPNLERVDTKGCDDYPVMFAIKTQHPEIEIEYTVPLAGVNVSSNDEFADISGIPVTDLDEIKERIGYLPDLKKIDMCGCGLTNDQFDVLIEAYPDIKFVFLISFGTSWSDVRTDITVFSSLSSSHATRFNEKTFAPLFKYCTDLVALDLGHNNIKDLSGVSNLTKLKQLIIMDNRRITDISPLSELSDLEWLELQQNRNVESIAPLASLKNLKWINISGLNVEDITPLCELPKLKKVVGTNMYKVSSKQKEELRAKLPEGCKFMLGEHIRSRYLQFWRSGGAYWGYRMACHNWRMVESMTGWDDVKYKDGYAVDCTGNIPVITKDGTIVEKDDVMSIPSK